MDYTISIILHKLFYNIEVHHSIIYFMFIFQLLGGFNQKQIAKKQKINLNVETITRDNSTGGIEKN